MAKPLVAQVIESPTVTVRSTDTEAALSVTGGGTPSASLLLGGTLGLILGGGDATLAAPGGHATISGDLARLSTTGAQADVEVDATGSPAVVRAQIASGDGARLALTGNDAVFAGGAISPVVPPGLTFAGANATLIAGGASAAGASLALTANAVLAAASGGTTQVVGDTATLRTADSTGVATLNQGAGTGSFGIADVGLEIAGGNATLQSPGGNVIANASNTVIEGDTVFVTGNNNMSGNYWGVDTVSLLASAAVSYPVLDQTQVPNIAISSRLNVEASSGTTTIHSLFSGFSPTNVDGRELLVQNVTTGPGADLILKNQSGTGTAGGRFFGSADLTIPPGGGVILTYDATVTADGAWLIRAPS